MSTLNVPEVTKELSELKSFFVSARTELQKGTVISVAGVDKRISSICKIIQAAEMKEQELFLPELSLLIELLNDYEKDLRAFQTAQLLQASQIASEEDQKK